MGSKLTDSVQRAFAILEAFNTMEPKVTLQQVSDKLSLPKVTTFRYLRTLVFLGYIFKEADSNFYKLSPKVLRLGFSMLAGMELREAALPYLEELSRTTGQNVGLGVLDRTEVVYVERIRKRRSLNVDLGVGSRVSAYRTAIGLAILAFLSDKEVEGVIEKILQKEPEGAQALGTDGKQLLRSLHDVRTRGYATDDKGYYSFMRSVGVPVFDGRGTIEGAINIVVFSDEISMEELKADYAPLLIDTAKKISSARGYFES
jgi:IclR family pca regulon transcriptional regulator